MTLEAQVKVRRVAPQIAALLLALGVVASIIGNSLHPSREDPMDNPRVFQEYAQSDGWIAAHLGQFAGYLFAFTGLIVLSQLLTGERTRTPLTSGERLRDVDGGAAGNRSAETTDPQPGPADG